MTARFGAVVLAAGAALRFGGGKLTASWQGEPMIVWAARAALDAADGPVVIVTGEGADGVTAALAPLRRERLQIVFAAGHTLGLAHSLRAALAALPPELEGVFIFLGDMPRVPPMGPALAAALTGEVLAAAPVFDGRRGHPALIARLLLPKLAGLSGDKGAGGLLDSLGEALALVETNDDGVLFDVDRRSDLGG